MSLKSELEHLAATIAKKAQEAKTPLQESVDALKALTGLYSALQKGRKGSDGDDEGDTFDDFAAQIAGNEEKADGGTPVRSRQ